MPRPTGAAAAPAHRDATTGRRMPRLRLLAALLLALALLPGLLPTDEAAPAALRLAAWFDQAPAELLAHVAACRGIGAAGARMVGCKVQLGSQPQECVYVPAKAPEPTKALAFLGLRKAKRSGPGSPDPAQLQSFLNRGKGWVWVLRGANDLCAEVTEPRDVTMLGWRCLTRRCGQVPASESSLPTV